MIKSKAASALFTVALLYVMPLAAVQAQTHLNQQCVTNIYMGNGVGVSWAGARASSNAIQIAYKARLNTQYPGQRFNFDISYNPTRGWREDVRELFLQRNPNPSPPDRWAGLTSAQLVALAQLSRTEITETEARAKQLRDNRTYSGAFWDIFRDDDPVEVAELAADAVREVLSKLDRFISLVGTNEYHSQLYRGRMMAGQRVIVVAHSQGNMFANHNVSTVIAENAAWAASIGIVGVATPADRTVNGGLYVTAHDDRVIDAMRTQYTVLASNIENDLWNSPIEDPRDVSNHYFVQSYLNPIVPSRANIDSQMLGLVGSLSFPQPDPGLSGSPRAVDACTPSASLSVTVDGAFKTVWSFFTLYDSEYEFQRPETLTCSQTFSPGSFSGNVFSSNWDFTDRTNCRHTGSLSVTLSSGWTRVDSFSCSKRTRGDGCSVIEDETVSVSDIPLNNGIGSISGAQVSSHLNKFTSVEELPNEQIMTLLSWSASDSPQYEEFPSRIIVRFGPK